jgi:hypothetical protein
MQGHAPQRQDEVPPPFRRQAIPENRGQPTEPVHRETQANVPTRAVLGIRSSAISRVLSNYQRHFVWGTENSLHWVMDMVFRDDECRVRTENAPANFTTLKHMAHNLIRKAPGKDSLRLRRKVAAWDDDFLASLIAA